MKLGRIILFTALFFGAKAVFKNRQAGTSAAGGSASGKTNDTMTPEELAELKKRLERQKLLQSICKNINIAKENDLGGLAGKSGYKWKKQMSGKEVIAMLKKNGWEYVKTKGGSHQKYEKNGQTVIIPVHGNKPLKIGTFKSIKTRISEIEKK